MTATSRHHEVKLNLTSIKANISIKNIVFYIVFTLASFYQELNQNFSQKALEFESSIASKIEAYCKIKTFHLRCNVENIESVDDFLKTIINHTNENKMQKISMIISNRNIIKLHTVESKLFIMDLIYKCIDHCQDIFSGNIFIINDISTITESTFEEKVLKYTKQMNSDLDVMFFDESSILNHSLLINKLFQNLTHWLAKSTHITLYYLISDSRETVEYVNSILSKISERFPACLDKVNGEFVYITKSKNEYIQPKISIRNGIFKGKVESYEVYGNNLIRQDSAKYPTKTGINEKITYEDRLNSTDIRLFKDTKIKDFCSSNFYQSRDSRNSVREAINIEHHFNYFKRYFFKVVEFNTSTKRVPYTNLDEKIIRIHDKVMMGLDEFDHSISNNNFFYSYIVDENGEIPQNEDFLMNQERKKTCLDIMKRVILNLSRYYQPFNFHKSCFYLLDKNWVYNECILLQGKRCFYFTEIKDLQVDFIPDQYNTLKNVLLSKENSQADEFKFDINPYYKNNIRSYLKCEDDKHELFSNLAISKEFKDIQKNAKLEGLVYIVKGKHYENNYYISLIPYAILDNEFFDKEKATTFFNLKMVKFWEINNSNINCNTEDFFSKLMKNKKVQDMPKNLLKYLFIYEGDKIKHINDVIDLVFQEKEKELNDDKDKEKSEILLANLNNLKEKAVKSISMSLNEMVNELYQFVYDLKTLVFIHSEFDYINSELDRITEESKKVFKELEN